MPKPARKLAVARSAPTRRKAPAARRAPTKPTVATAAAAPVTLMLADGWADAIDIPLRQAVNLGGVVHMALKVKVTDAGTATWNSIALTGASTRPSNVRDGLPCAVYDASAGRWYMAVASVASGGNVSVTRIGASADGSLQPPFAIGVGDELRISFTYAM